MWIVTSGATFNNRGVFKDLWPADALVAGGTLLSNGTQRRLLGSMGIMAARTGSAALFNRVMRWQVEFSQHVLVASGTQGCGLSTLQLGGIQLLDFIGVHAMALGTLDTGLIVLGKGEMSALLV